MFRSIPILLLVACFGLQAADPGMPAGLPPLPPSPLQQFRAWLSMPEAERETTLATWPAEKQKVLREKLVAYQLLPSAQRDRRLTMLELRWYLRPLMKMPPEQRATHLQAVPVPIQPMVHDRLQAWDKIPSATRAELLENEESNELVMAYFAQIRRGIPQDQIFRGMPETKLARLRTALENWNRTTLPERQEMAAQLALFFQMPREEQSKTLSGLSPAEQADIERTLEAFAQLPAQQRRACVNSFQKFARMTPEDRSSFLRNAARWQAMTPSERETWKEIVAKLPPMPPEPVELPPMPQAAVSLPNLAATNDSPR